MRKTKIICTLGPAAQDVNMIGQLIDAGMNVARFNFSHGTHASHLAMYKNLLAARQQKGKPIAALLDTKGPEIRTKLFQDAPLLIAKGAQIAITDVPLSDIPSFSTTYPNLYQELHVNSHIYIDDGLLAIEVEAIENSILYCRSLSDGEIRNNKGINLPDDAILLPALTAKDEEDILFAIAHDFDFIAASFVRQASDVEAIRNILQSNHGERIKIIAKIENKQGVQNIDEILDSADGIMIARGDLGVEIPPYEVPLVQKSIIQKCNYLGKPVIVATQMLESMTHHMRPTRAEASDVANAVYDGADVIMLSGETASGDYPIESVQMMHQIAACTEENIAYWGNFLYAKHARVNVISDAISHSCCMTAMDLSAKAIITITQSGHTAQCISRYHPGCPIIALAANEKIQRQLSLYWGIYAIFSPAENHLDALLHSAIETALQTPLVTHGDTVVITAGSPIGISNTTNMIKAQILP